MFVDMQGIYPLQTIGGQDYHLQNSQYLCLDLVLAFVGHMASRAEGVGISNASCVEHR